MGSLEPLSTLYPNANASYLCDLGLYYLTFLGLSCLDCEMGTILLPNSEIFGDDSMGYCILRALHSAWQ